MGRSAVEAQDVARDVPPQIRGQEQHGRRDVPRFGRAWQWCDRLDHGPLRLSHFREGAWRADEARGDAVDPDVAVSVLDGRTLNGVMECGLGRAVKRLLWQTDQAGHRPDEGHGTPATLGEDRTAQVHDQNRGAEDDRKLPLDRQVVEVRKGLIVCHPDNVYDTGKAWAEMCL